MARNRRHPLNTRRKLDTTGVATPPGAVYASKRQQPKEPDMNIVRKRTPVPETAGGNQRPLANLEMDGDRLKMYSLRTLLTNKRRPDTRDAARLGDVLLPWYEQAVVKPAAKLHGLVEVWQEHVPAAIVKRSRLLGFHRGTLTVALDSSTVRAELDVRLRGGLLRTMQVASKGSLYRIKTCVEGAVIPEAAESQGRR
jgi:hypothetical protein